VDNQKETEHAKLLRPFNTQPLCEIFRIHAKKERSHQDNFFEYQWQLEMRFPWPGPVRFQVQLNVLDYWVNPEVPDEQQQQQVSLVNESLLDVTDAYKNGHGSQTIRNDPSPY